MSWFLESPWPSLALGLAVLVVLAIAFARTGRGALVIAAGAVVLLTTGMLAIERSVVTEREAVEDALDAVAAALVSNDTPAVLALFDPESARRNEVQSVLSRVTIRDARIGGDLEVRLNDLTIPPSASTWFTGRVEARDNSGTIPYEHMIRKFSVKLHKRNGRWLIHDYSDADVRAR